MMLTDVCTLAAECKHGSTAHGVRCSRQAKSDLGPMSPCILQQSPFQLSGTVEGDDEDGTLEQVVSVHGLQAATHHRELQPVAE